MLESTHEARLQRARLSLEGLSVGDSLGGFFEFNRSGLSHYIKERKVPQVEWHFTDDTNMALSIYSILRQFQYIDQDKLAANFAEHFDRGRGYGRGARALVTRMKAGQHWRKVAGELYGEGSYGNGGAMRVAPLGAYFADDWDALVENARLSAEITHAHPEGIAGAITVALAAAYAAQLRGHNKPTQQAFIDQLLPYIPESDVKTVCIKARDLPADTDVQQAIHALGNGGRVTAQDTVPYAVWCAATWLDDYTEAFWQTASGGGDVDTTCAMVGGIVAMFIGNDGIPAEWLKWRERLPDWAFEE